MNARCPCTRTAAQRHAADWVPDLVLASIGEGFVVVRKQLRDLERRLGADGLLSGGSRTLRRCSTTISLPGFIEALEQVLSRVQAIVGIATAALAASGIYRDPRLAVRFWMLLNEA